MSSRLKLGLLAVLVLSLAACGAPTPLPPSPLPPTATATAPAATLAPTLTTAASGSPLPRTILLDAPLPGQAVSSPVEIRGSVSISPFESNLRTRVYDAAGQVVGEGYVTVQAPMGEPGPFSGSLAFTVRGDGPGRVEVADISAADGSVIAAAAVDVALVAAPAAGAIEIPAAGARVTLPLHILARAGRPGEQLTVSLTWQDGTTLKQNVPVLPGEDGAGLVVTSIDWMSEGPPPMPATQPATLELWSPDGDRIAAQDLTVLNPQDPDVQQVLLYFLLGESLQPVQRNIVRTEGIGAAALDELLWGPPPNNLAGFETALPTPETVLTFPGRGPDWGSRVTLRQLTIVDGLATADFSKEMAAYGGGSLRVKLLRDQIAATLMQFPTVKQVLIAVEGQTEGVLEP